MMFLQKTWSTNAWYTSFDDLGSVFAGYFSTTGRRGEVWGLHTPLDILKDTTGNFRSVYIDTLFGRLEKKVVAVKLVLGDTEYATFCSECRTSGSPLAKNLRALEAKCTGALTRILVRPKSTITNEVVAQLPMSTVLGFCAVRGRLSYVDSPLFFYRLQDVFHPEARLSMVMASYLTEHADFERLRPHLVDVYTEDSFVSVASLLGDGRVRATTSQCVGNDIRVLIVVALREEYVPIVTRVFSELKEVNGERRSYHEGILRSNEGSCLYHLFAVDCVDMGSVDAAVVTAAGCAEFNPDYVVLLGIAGGRRNKVRNLGDVVVGQMVTAYEYQKLHDKRICWLMIKSEDRYRSAPADVQLKDMANEVRVRWQPTIVGQDGKEYRPEAYPGTVLSGSKVVTSGVFMAREGTKDGAVVAVEMEGEGVARAAALAGRGSIVIKGVSDWADGTKGGLHDKVGRQVATQAAAEFLREGLLKGALHARNS